MRSLMFWCALTFVFAAPAGLFAEDSADEGVVALVEVLAAVDEADVQRDVLNGMYEALRGRRAVPMPAQWAVVSARLQKSKDEMVRERTQALSVLFGDSQAIAALRALVADSKAVRDARTRALATLLQRHPDDLLSLLERLLQDPELRGAAIKSLSAYPSERTPALILKEYARCSVSEKEDAINTLASRKAWIPALLDALEQGRIPRKDVSAFTARQVVAYGDAQFTARLTKAWGELRPPSAEKTEQFARFKKILTPELLQMADRSHGRKIFAQSCASCHKLFSEGGAIGPELTGAQRNNLDYVLENMLDPSAVVGRDYQVTIVQTTEGRTIHGIVRQENANALVMQTPNDLVTIPKIEIEERVRSTVSLMPEGMLSRLTDDEVRALVAYLGSPGQVPLPTEKSNK